MSAPWPLMNLEDICEILDRFRKPISKKNRIAGDIPYYGATGIVDYVNDYIFDEKLVLIGEDGAKWGAGDSSAFSIEGKTWVNNHAHVLRPKREIIIDNWLIYYLNMSDLTENITGVTVPKLNQAKLRKIPIPVPPLKEQQRIVSTLDEAFEKIEESIKNTESQSISSLENYRSASKSIFEESGEDWVKTTLGQICTLQRGFDLPKRLRAKGDFPLVSASGVIDTHNIAKVTGPGVTTGRSGTIGKVNYIEDDFWPLNTALYVKDFHGNHPRFIYHFLLEFGLERFAGGTGVPTLNRNLVHPVEVIIPSSIEEQIAIADKLDLLHMETKNYETTLAEKQSSLFELKQSILQEAFNGNL